MRSIIGGTLITRKGRLISSLGVRSEPPSERWCWGFLDSSFSPVPCGFPEA